MSRYKTLDELIVHLAEGLRPPERMTVSEAAEKYIRIKKVGLSDEQWSARKTPYMTEPMNELRNRLMRGVVFCGPAQCGKTEALILGWLAYTAMIDPMDMMIVNPTQKAARDFAVRRIDRMHRDSPDIGGRLLKSRSTDSKQTKQYTSGMLVDLSWPTVSETRGKPIGRCAATDYDGIEDNIGGEGSLFDLLMARTRSFMSFGKVLAESSPSKPLTDPQWSPSTPHEAPPCNGILSLYNRGDRRRWYWPCPNCNDYFETRFSDIQFDQKERNAVAAGDSAHLLCPVCTHKILPGDREAMLEYGSWVKEGQRIVNFKVTGTPVRSDIASFWLSGAAAGLTDWRKLVTSFVQAKQETERTGSEDGLIKFWNADAAEVFISKSQQSARTPDSLMKRAEALPEREVPKGCVAMVATIDVQKSMFIVQVHGIMPGVPHDLVIIDRFKLYKSKRKDGENDYIPVNPGAYQEDWDLIEEEVINRSYPLADGSGRRMRIHMTTVDSAGREGVTANAYAFQRKMREKGLAPRFHLTKGEPNPKAPRAFIEMPDSKQRGLTAIARGDVPVLFINSLLVKNMLHHRLDVVTPGAGMIHFPKWLQIDFYQELCREVFDGKRWENPGGMRNETWDLLYYCIGVLISSLFLIEKEDWTNPSEWLSDWDVNPNVFNPLTEETLTGQRSSGYDFRSIGKKLA